MSLTRWWRALSLPLGWTRPTPDQSTLPVGVQQVGAPGADRLLLELGASLETAAPWADHHPPTGSSLVLCTRLRDSGEYIPSTADVFGAAPRGE